MPITINGTTGIAGVDGSAGTPVVQGTDTNTGMFFPAADTIAFAEGGVEAMRIDSSGNLGIGTSSPAYKLDVRSSLAVLDGSANIGFYANGTSYTQIWQTFQSPNDLLIKTTAAKYIAFLPNSTEAMRIDTSGQLILKRTAAVNAASFVCSATQNTRAVSFVNNNNNNEVGYIFLNNDGTTTQYATSSDYRLKENIAPMTGALSVVEQLKPVTYKWKINGADGQGFIAHELQAVVPDCVTGEKDDVETYTDEDGIEQTRPKYQGVDTSFLVATLTAAIQELKAIVDAQAIRIETLEAK